MGRSPEHKIWLDRYAETLGFGWLSGKLPGDVPPSYLYAIILILLIDPLLSLWSYVGGYRVVYLDNPYFVLQPLALVTAVYASRSLMASYDAVMDEMDIERRASDDEREDILDIVPGWLPWSLFVLGVSIEYMVVASIGLSKIYQTGGPAGLIAWLLVNPLVWVPIAIQFFSVYISIEFLAPWRLVNSGVGIHFMDPEGLGGLRPIGELIKQAYYYMMAGLVAYALILYHPLVEISGPGPTSFTNVTFTTIWLVSIGTVAFAVFTLHRFMHREKREELDNLRQQVRDYVENPYDVADYTVPDDREEEVAELRRRMELVSSTSEYPATFSIWSQLLLAVVIPKAVQLLLSYM